MLPARTTLWVQRFSLQYQKRNERKNEEGPGVGERLKEDAFIEESARMQGCYGSVNMSQVLDESTEH